MTIVILYTHIYYIKIFHFNEIISLLNDMKNIEKTSCI